MCGIFGIVAAGNADISSKRFKAALAALFTLSESRGKEAAGLAVRCSDGLHVHKSAGRATAMIRSDEYRDTLGPLLERLAAGEPVAAIGHSRLMTNGRQSVNDNNQPVATPHSVGIHNGIITNVETLWRDHPHLERKSDVDTEIVFRLMDDARRRDLGVRAAMGRTYGMIQGVANLAFFTDDRESLFLSTNNGSIHWVEDKARGLFLFASEAIILHRAIAKALPELSKRPITRLMPGKGLEIGLADSEHDQFTLAGATDGEPKPAKPIPLLHEPGGTNALRRCTRCILPETFPGISFDADGVCSQCRSHQPHVTLGRDALAEVLERHRRTDGRPDCILALSGGRDSCYGLHVLKQEMGMNPIAFTYDWGMVTDLARRNISRQCAALGVEHMVRSPDIAAKRRYIRHNVQAWLRKPELGMVPLFMAGDKAFFHHARQLRSETGIDLVVFCAGNPLERTEFKSGFCGVRESQHGQRLYAYSVKNKIGLLLYYMKQYAVNPGYWNASMLDTLFAYYATYIARDDFSYLYHYIPWDEGVIMETLRREYGWEDASDAQTTWRVGDGTAAFYNYIYHTVAGFSEHDTFRSNQVRAGLIDRDEALRLSAIDNQPRWEAMRDYAALIGFNLEEALAVINAIPKLRIHHREHRG